MLSSSNDGTEKSDFRKLFTLQAILILDSVTKFIHAAEEKVTYLHETRKFTATSPLIFNVDTFSSGIRCLNCTALYHSHKPDEPKQHTRVRTRS